MAKRPVKNLLTGKNADLNAAEDDDVHNDQEAENEEDLELEKFLEAFQNLKTDLALINHELEDPLEIKELRNLTPSKSDTKKYMTSEVPKGISVMSWNIDFHLTHLGKRTVAIVDLLEAEDHDIILLQEVRTLSFNYIVSRLEDKYFIIRQENNTFYYTATLLKRDTVKYESHKMIYFRNTSQGRSILFTKAMVGGAKMDIMNVHLESQGGKEMSQIRVAQLKKCMAIASATPGDSNVIIGGDFNIRESEIKQVPLPKRTCDLWVSLGAMKSTEHTWDMTVNKNLVFDIPVQPPPKRFDRLYFRSSSPETLKPEFFGLTGKKMLQDIEEVGHFPSDHWALVSKLSLHPSVQYYCTDSPTPEKASSSANVDKDQGEDEDENIKECEEDVVKENWYDDD